MSSNDTLLNGRYQLVSTLGSGGMAVIYKAVDQALGRPVAVKIMRPQLTKDPAFVARFQSEARNVANLSHPNIVTVHDVGTAPTADGVVHYMVMEYIPGQDLKKFIRDKTLLTPDLALNFAIQICAGIGFAHRAGLVHADVKPQNVLLTKDSTMIKVTDFGIAQAWSDSQPVVQEREAIVWGSPHYFAPEQARGEKPTAASDVYSIGIVMFEMLTGRLPYMGASQHDLALAHIREKVPSVTDVVPGISPDLAKVVQRVMSKEPSARFRTADQLGHVLINLRDKEKENSKSARPATPPTLSSTPIPPQASKPNPAGGPPAPPVSQPIRQDTPMPAPPQYQPAPPPPMQAGMQTQRINTAPEAPSSPQYGRPMGAASQNPVVQPPQPLQSGPGLPQYTPQAPPMQPPMATYDSRRMAPPPPYGEAAHSEKVLDTVTIILVILAFVAVAGLIPLFIAVFQSYY